MQEATFFYVNRMMTMRPAMKIEDSREWEGLQR